MESIRSPMFLSVAIVCIIAEAVWRIRSGRGYDGRAAMATLGLVAGNLVAGAVNAATVGSAFGAIHALVPHRFPIDHWTSWALGFLGVEIAYYGFHRASHRVRWMWATHSVHHSAEEMTFLASMRLGWTNFLSLGWLAYTPLVALGFDPRMVVMLLAINLNYQFFLHSEAIPRLGPIEWLLNTPAHHRTHHASNPEYIDRNFGGMLIIWDRLFGTIAPTSDVPIIYGVAGRPRNHNPVSIAFREWVSMLSDARAKRGVRRLETLYRAPPVH